MMQSLVKFRDKKKGFTLVELIVVIAIIGILAAILMPKFMGFTDDARKSAAVAEAKSIRSIAETYYAKNGTWPTTAAGSGFKVGDSDVTFSGTIAANTGTNPLTDGSFKYTKNTFTATCDANGNITAPS